MAAAKLVKVEEKKQLKPVKKPGETLSEAVSSLLDQHGNSPN